MSVLPKGWVETILGDFIELKYGKSLPTQKRTGEGVPVYGSSGIVGHHSEALVSRRGLIVGRKGSYGVVNKSDQSFFPIDTTYYVDEFYGQPIEFWFYFLRYLPLTEMNRSTAIPGLNREDAYSLVVKVPPLNEQIRIVNKLDSLLAKVDASQTRLERIPTLLKRFRQSVLAAATSGELTREWRSINKYEFNWAQLELGDVAEVHTGVTPLKKEAGYYDGGVIPWLTSSVTGQRLVTEAQYFITEKAIKECRLKLFKSGTLLVAMYGEGKTRGQVTEIAIEATINQACAAVIVDENKAVNNYIKLSIEANYENTRMMAEGGNQPNLNLSKVRQIPISLPNKREQLEIIRRVESLFALVEVIQKQYSEARQHIDRLTQSLLAKAFRGELVSQDPRDEPASELLNRIRSDQLHVGFSPKSSKKSVRKMKSKISSGKSKMSKSRKDDDVWHQPYLANIIEKAGPIIGAQELYGKADLIVGDFYKQLAWEEKQNYIVAEGDMLRLNK